ncbi:hypothetical protein [Adlercreutzia sp. ZJ138]|uniref:hypothetical protein n=1 Tax=Adlercreutzia sp. ZJ138 TaxID=2709405 RepID=UPI0013EA59C0|nr:hypothetical protein [Adlercreutzia sp. ZJ138]
MSANAAAAAERLAGNSGAAEVPRARARWFLVRVPEGREAATCERVRSCVPNGLVEDAFVARKERWFKRGGTWRLEPVRMHKGYFVAASRDGRALARELSRLSFPVELAGAPGADPAPMPVEAQSWLEAAMDASRVLRNSTAVIEGGQLHVQSGPLVGQEPRVLKVDRHHRCCTVRVGGPSSGFCELLPMEVPYKS